MVFVHGTGYGVCDNSFGDVASDMVSADFVTAVLDKPVWNITDINRDYPASAKVCDQIIEYLRDQGDVDEAKVDIYATSESTWTSSYLLEDDPDIASQILLDPMVSSPRQSLGFSITQDFTLADANGGYQFVIQRVFNADTGLSRLNNFNLATLKPAVYAISTYMVYSPKGVITAQVDGVRVIFYNIRKADSWNVTVRGYPVVSHMSRLGDEFEAGTPFVDAYADDLTDWAVGTSARLMQTSEEVAGTNLYQSVGLPSALKTRRVGTVYGVVLHVTVALLLLASTVLALMVLGREVAADARWRREKYEAEHAGMLIPERSVILGFTHGFDSALLTLTSTIPTTLPISSAGLGQVIMGMVKLAWGSAPTKTSGVMYWSWPVIQVVSVLVL